METIHSFWISGALKPLNLLTIKSFLSHGHNVVIYTYDVPNFIKDLDVAGLSLGATFSIRDAREILPESEIFYYKNMLGGNPNFKFGGIAERLKAEMLFQIGGWHVDLDVTCLSPFDLHDEYVLRPHNTHAVVGNIIRAPKWCELARRYVEHTKTIDENNRIWEKSFLGLNDIVRDLGLERFIKPREVLGNDSDEYWKMFLKAGSEVPAQLKAVHWCAAMNYACEPDSVLDNLYKKYSL